jgi:hypothetical protein
MRYFGESGSGKLAQVIGIGRFIVIWRVAYQQGEIRNIRTKFIIAWGTCD